MSGAGTDHHLTMGRGPNMQTKQYSVHLLISLLEQKYTGEQLRGHGCDMSDQYWKQLHFKNNIYMPNLWLHL